MVIFNIILNKSRLFFKLNTLLKIFCYYRKYKTCLFDVGFQKNESEKSSFPLQYLYKDHLSNKLKILIQNKYKKESNLNQN